MTAPPPGWYPSPEPATDPYPFRWWDGERWAEVPSAAIPQYAAPTGFRSTAAARRSSYLPSLVAATGGILIFVGSLLPWISVTSSFASISRTGIHFNTDGTVELVLGILAVAAAGIMLIGQAGRWIGFALAVFIGGIGLAAGIYDLHLVDERVADIDALGLGAFHTSVGAGIVLVVVGAAIVLVAAALSLALEVAAQRRSQQG